MKVADALKLKVGTLMSCVCPKCGVASHPWEVAGYEDGRRYMLDEDGLRVSLRKVGGGNQACGLSATVSRTDSVEVF